MKLVHDGTQYITLDKQTTEEEQGGLLQTAFKDGKQTKTITFDEVKANSNK